MEIQQVYEYGVRIDAECRGEIWNQFILSRKLYNELVACMRDIYQQMQDYTIEHADGAAAILAAIEVKNEAFQAAKAAKDDDGLKSIAVERRELWRELSPILKATRTAHKTEIQEQFLSKIGKRSDTPTYQLRSQYVDKGLGWATANQVLDRALIAWKKRFVQGKPPLFKKASEIKKDTLTLQFTAKGGISPGAIFSGKSKELSIERSAFGFRLGPAAEKSYAEGVINLHRSLPEGTTGVPLARLVCEQVADKERYKIQLQVAHDLQVEKAPGRKPLLAVHLGWNHDVSGRRVAGINDSNDVSTAEVVQLPDSIEADLLRAAQFQSKRDESRDQLHTRIKEWPLSGDDAIDEEIIKIQRLPAQYIEQSRIHRLIERCWKQGIDNQPDWLRAWKSQDKKDWQAEVGIARRARNRRKNFYTELVRGWCAEYDAIVIETLDLKEAALKLNEKTGEKTEFSKKARAGRVVASLYELQQVLKWQAIKHGVAVIEKKPATVSTCAYCGSNNIHANKDDWQRLDCHDCGAQTDRKENGATVLHQVAAPDIERDTVHYFSEQQEKENAALLKKADKLKRMQESRKARSLSGAEMA